MTLPRLYTLKEVREALQVGHEYVRLALKRYPQIRPIGRGRGTRLTYQDYMLLLELMRQPPDPIVKLLPSAPPATKEEINAVRQTRRQGTRAALKDLRARLLRDGQG